MLTFEEKNAIAKSVARRYKSRGVRASIEDMQQDAWVAMLMAEKSKRFDPALGVPEQYFRGAAYRWVRGRLWKLSSPLSIGSEHSAEKIRGVLAVPVKDETLGMFSGFEDMISRKMILERVRAVVIRDIGYSSEAVVRVIVKEARPAEAARESGVSVQYMYAALDAARSKLGASPDLWKCWHDLYGQE